MDIKDSGSRNKYLDLVKQIAEEHEVPFFILDSLIQHESEYKPTARSKKGAIGLTQLMPKTADILRVDPHDPEQNIRGGARYLADMLTRFGDMEKALIAYNAGPGRVSKPPRVSRKYARNVMGLARKLEPWTLEGFEESPLSVSLTKGMTR